MKIYHYCFASVIAVVGMMSCMAAVEIGGKILEVRGTAIRIASDSNLLPRPGDPVEVYFELEGLDEVAWAGNGAVTAIEDGVILVRITTGIERVRVGYQVKIISEKPTGKEAKKGHAGDDSGMPTLQSVRVKNRSVFGRTAAGDERQLSSGGTDYDPALSPDGTRVVFVRSTPGVEIPTGIGGTEGTELWLVNADGKNSRRILSARASDDMRQVLAGFSQPVFTSGGSAICFVSAAWATSGAIHRLDIDTGKTRFLTAGDTLARDRTNDFLVVGKTRLVPGKGRMETTVIVNPRTGEEVGTAPSAMKSAVDGTGTRTIPKALAVVEVPLSREEQRRLNVFFSNFSEVFHPTFRRGEAKAADLIHFGILHNVINNPRRLSRASRAGYQLLSADYVAESIQKYFGLSLDRHQSTADFKFSGSSYEVPLADGEAYRFSQVIRLLKNNDGTFTAHVQNYEVPNWVEIDPHANPLEWKKSGKEVPRPYQKIAARIRKVERDGHSRYILIEYLGAP